MAYTHCYLLYERFNKLKFNKMTNEEIIEALKEEITLLYNCTDDPIMKAKLKRISSGDIVLRCKCPMCGEKFMPEDGMKLSERIL
ncbi:MAG: hypothetical protein HRU18_11270 [Pseudoalteromonas sp.]|nr:hypothetical protein [Pseudoalteromonas sp.]